MNTKTCRDCNTTKPTSDFHIFKESGRPRSYCKPCASKRSSWDAKKREAKIKLKTCKTCNVEQPETNFYMNRGYRIGTCKSCRSIYHKKRNTIENERKKEEAKDNILYWASVLKELEDTV